MATGSAAWRKSRYIALKPLTSRLAQDLERLFGRLGPIRALDVLCGVIDHL